MKKRLRKKLRRGEFSVVVVPIAFRMREIPQEMQNNLLDRFIKEAIEANDLQFGGGGHLRWAGFAEPQAWPGSISSQQRAAIASWLEAEQDIVQHYVGEITLDSKVESGNDPDYPRSQLDRI
ncbi:MAG: YggL family protein [Desulfobulbaceae bacterium]|nr:YggL family protein [Desulfobulbaceae bacterium]